MATNTITVNAAERVAQATAKVEAARIDLAMAEAELRVWQQLEREAKAAPLARAQVGRAGNERSSSLRGLPALESNRTETGTATKRDRRPIDKWMKVLGQLEAGPVTQEDLAESVRAFGIDKRALSDQVRRYLGPLELLVEEEGKLALTARARQFLDAYAL